MRMQGEGAGGCTGGTEAQQRLGCAGRGWAEGTNLCRCAQGNRPQLLYSVLCICPYLYSVYSSRGCLAPKHLCCKPTPVKLSGNVMSLPSAHLQMGVNDNLLFVIPVPPVKNNSDPKCPGSAEESPGFTPALLTLLYQTCFSILDALLHTRYTCITHRMRTRQGTLKFWRCLRCLYDFSPDRLLAVQFHRQKCHGVRQDTHTSHSASSCRTDLGCAAKGKLLGKLLPEKLGK